MPCDINETLKTLPREFDASETIQLKFMRKLEYNNPYLFDKISPKKIKNALDILLRQELFKEHNINLSVNWTFHNAKDDDVVDFIVNPNDVNPDHSKSAPTSTSQSSNSSLIFNSQENSQTRLVRKKQNDKTGLISRIEKQIKNMSESSGSEEDFFAPNNIAAEKLPTLLDNEVIVAPGEGFFPKPIVFDKNADELTFLKIYGGKPANYPRGLSYMAICKSEFRRYDRRCAENITKLFFSYKKLVASKLIQSINTSLKKTNKSMNLTVAEALDDESMRDFFTNNEGLIF